MAPSNEYSTASGGGGRLKLKGSKVQDGRVEKKRKKKKVKNETDPNADADTKEVERGKEVDGARTEREGSDAPEIRESRSRGGSEGASASGVGVMVGKTEAERRYEEARRKRVSSYSIPYQVPA